LHAGKETFATELILDKTVVKKLLFSFLLFGGIPVLGQQIFTLEKALQTARDHNIPLKAGQLNIKLSEADAVTAAIRPNPELNNQTLQFMQPSHFPDGTRWYSGQNNQIWWQLTKPFQLAGQRKYKMETAGKHIELAENTYLDAERNLLAEAAAKWLEVWTAQKQLEIVEEARTNADSLVKTNNLRHANQVITQTDLSRTQLLARQFAFQQLSAKQNLVNLQRELQLLLGVSESAEVDMDDAFTRINFDDLDALVLKAMGQRSDVLMAGSLIALSESNIKLQKALAWPQPELGFIWNPQNTFRYFGLFATVDLPFFDRNQGEISKSKILKQQAEIQLDFTQKRLKTEIENAYSAYQIHRKNVADFESVLGQSEQILESIQYAYLRGGTTIIDFLEAQRSWLETRQHYYETLQKYRESYIALLYSTGLINQLANE
jgi:cobalt-zinc-cadmium efflux system outer membrane protein